jgi:pantoate--beta-alanine ligase
MQIIKDPKKMFSYSQKERCRGKTIALVPTMGYLHEGHLSLVEAAKRKADRVVVSIFVNPTQFGPGEDLSRYPQDLKRDQKLLKSFEVDVLFCPRASAIYPAGEKTYVEVEGLSKKLCGLSRPTHFRGVATVVAKLLNIAAPDYAFFGEKDFQQLVIIKRMVKDLHLPVEIISLPTVREYDGLAMSSRNKYLNAKQRKSAGVLYRALCLAKQEIEKGERKAKEISRRMNSLIKKETGVRLGYLAIVDPETLETVEKIKNKVLIALAAYAGKARLIDNLLIEV